VQGEALEIAMVGGHHLYVAAGPGGVTVFDVRLPASPNYVTTVLDGGASRVPGQVVDLAAAGRHLMVARYRTELLVLDATGDTLALRTRLDVSTSAIAAVHATTRPDGGADVLVAGQPLVESPCRIPNPGCNHVVRGSGLRAVSVSAGGQPRGEGELSELALLGVVAEGSVTFAAMSQSYYNSGLRSSWGPGLVSLVALPTLGFQAVEHLALPDFVPLLATPLEIEGNRVFAVGGNSPWVYVVSHEAGQRLALEARFVAAGVAHDLAVRGRHLLVAGSDALQVVDVEAGGGPREIGRLRLSAAGVQVAWAGDYGLLATYDGRVVLLDLSDPARPRTLDEIRLAAGDAPLPGGYAGSGRPTRMVTEGDRAFLALERGDIMGLTIVPGARATALPSPTPVRSPTVTRAATSPPAGTATPTAMPTRPSGALWLPMLEAVRAGRR
jgi:hypothetical protein